MQNNSLKLNWIADSCDGGYSERWSHWFGCQLQHASHFTGIEFGCHLWSSTNIWCKTYFKNRLLSSQEFCLTLKFSLMQKGSYMPSLHPGWTVMPCPLAFQLNLWISLSIFKTLLLMCSPILLHVNTLHRRFQLHWLPIRARIYFKCTKHYMGWHQCIFVIYINPYTLSHSFCSANTLAVHHPSCKLKTMERKSLFIRSPQLMECSSLHYQKFTEEQRLRNKYYLEICFLLLKMWLSEWDQSFITDSCLIFSRLLLLPLFWHLF